MVRDSIFFACDSWVTDSSPPKPSKLSPNWRNSRMQFFFFFLCMSTVVTVILRVWGFSYSIPSRAPIAYLQPPHYAVAAFDFFLLFLCFFSLSPLFTLTCLHLSPSPRLLLVCYQLLAEWSSKASLLLKNPSSPSRSPTSMTPIWKRTT